MAANES